jgi:hypothetical protein
VNCARRSLVEATEDPGSIPGTSTTSGRPCSLALQARRVGRHFVAGATPTGPTVRGVLTQLGCVGWAPAGRWGGALLSLIRVGNRWGMAEAGPSACGAFGLRGLRPAGPSACGAFFPSLPFPSLPLWRLGRLWGGVGETGGMLRGGVRAGVVGGVVGGVPSTVWALVGRGDPLGAAVAAGRLLLPGERRRGVLLIAALPVHFGISAAWGVVLARVLPGRRTVWWGVVAGLVIAAVDLRVPGRRAEAVRELSVLPQVVDHLVYGGVVGIYLRRRALRLR